MTSGSGGPPKSIGHYVLMKTIGEGTFGKVKLGTHILTGERVAVKVLEKERIVEAADVERVAREIHILKLIRKCRHIIQLYEMIETPRQLYLIMEYAPGGELFDYIVERGRAEESEACRFLHQILAGVERVHEHCVVHRDLKPENIVFSMAGPSIAECGSLKIIDFGMACACADGEELRDMVGTTRYMAPQVVRRKYDKRCDIWSLGVIAYLMLSGHMPIGGGTEREILLNVREGRWAFDGAAWEDVGADAKHLVKSLLRKGAESRISVAGALDHVWLEPAAANDDVAKCSSEWGSPSCGSVSTAAPSSSCNSDGSQK
mmetsp:Transcript_106818/g.308983  ORF Transcript_106818/g.308983 Transcript_106818/m.308983 type:complete len:318 (-) Transcript_106818:114-1067(-)